MYYCCKEKKYLILVPGIHFYVYFKCPVIGYLDYNYNLHIRKQWYIVAINYQAR